ncbi:MAG: M3 family metallopeptidase [Gammaproteobacteria bacterium]|nr:M3 family metallopeptidase [Gammaproteobacteria bacterium]
MFATQRDLASISRKNRLFNPALSRVNEILLKIPFDFSTLTVDKIGLYVKHLVCCYEMTYDDIASLSETSKKLTFENVVQPLIDLSIIEQTATRLCCFAKDIHTDKAVRDCSAEATETLEKLEITHSQREDVFKTFLDYQKNIYPQEKSHLHPEEIRYFEQLMLQYKRSGLMITDPAIRDEIMHIKKRIAELSVRFEQNLNEVDTQFILSAEDLKGLPESWLENADRHLAVGLYKVTLKYPDVLPILNYAQNRETRKKIYTAFENRCAEENIPLLKEILILRQRLATLLGYSSYVDYACELRMAKNGNNVEDFLDQMNHRFDAALAKNLHDLTQFAREKEKDSTLQLELYDMRYYSRFYTETFYSINLEEVKSYFPLNKVLQGTLDIYQHILGLKFVAYDDKTIWHPDVRTYSVFDTESKNCIGKFYLDLHPRDGKYGHAAVSEQLASCDISQLTGIPNNQQIPISVMMCNFPKNENVPFEDVVTFFHEFGHLMHFTCSKTKLASMHAGKTELDFVEAPSQMLENWCYEPAALKLLSAHKDTGEPLPHETALKMKQIDNIFAGYVYKRQLTYAYYDYYIHSMSADELEKLNIPEFYRTLLATFTQLPIVPGTCTPASFAHVVGEYDAGYYGYLYSEVFAHDMYASVFKADPLSPESGKKYRQCILEPGASQDADVLLHHFLGRAPRMDAFLQHLALDNVEAETHEPARKRIKR